MSYWKLCLFLISFLLAAPAVAHEQKAGDHADEIAIELQRQAVRDRYNYQNYISRLTACARSDESDSRTPACQLEVKKERKYEPLNPIILFRW